MAWHKSTSGGAVVLILASIAAAQNPSHPQPTPPDPADSRASDDAERPTRPPLGPTDPGPYPQMPGYFTKKAQDLNYRQTPFFSGQYGVFVPQGAGNDYFPGVYPYYDAQFHYQWYQAHAREQQLTQGAESMRRAGLELFHKGDYEAAAVQFLGAADLNQGDPIARIHAGHCQFALGQYAAAVEQLRRGFELQPALAYMRFDPRSDYQQWGDFEEHAKALRAYVEKHADDAAAAAVLGYMIYFTEGTTRARPLLEKAHALNPDEGLVNKLLRVADRASYSAAAARTPRRDARTYDQMGVRSQRTSTYDEQRRPAAPDAGRRFKSDPKKMRRI